MKVVFLAVWFAGSLDFDLLIETVGFPYWTHNLVVLFLDLPHKLVTFRRSENGPSREVVLVPAWLEMTSTTGTNHPCLRGHLMRPF